MGFIKPLLSMLDDKTLYVMARDIAETDNLGDAPMWAEFLAKIEKERKRKKNDEKSSNDD